MRRIFYTITVGMALIVLSVFHRSEESRVFDQYGQSKFVFENETMPQFHPLYRLHIRWFGVSDDYVDLQKQYRKLLFAYLNAKMSFDDADAFLNEAEFPIPKPVSSLSAIGQNRDYSFYYSDLDSDYFYLRNSIYIERLTSQEVSVLRKSQGRLTEESKDLIDQTMLKVLSVYPEKVSHYVSYDVGEEKFYSSDIVLRIDSALPHTTEFQEKMEELEEVFTNQLGMSVRISY